MGCWSMGLEMCLQNVCATWSQHGNIYYSSILVTTDIVLRIQYDTCSYLLHTVIQTHCTIKHMCVYEGAVKPVFVFKTIS